MAQAFWLIPLFPAAGAFLIFLFGGRLSRKAVSLVACSTVTASLLLTLAAGWRFLAYPEAAPLSKTLYSWISGASLKAAATLVYDPLAAVMAVVVTGVGLLIHIYSAGYMAGDKSWVRYFALLNLFTFFMLLLVMAGNIILLLVGWEGVGLCSYLLIGFWFERPSAAAAGKKAFLVNRVGDAAFLCGVLLLLANVGSGDLASLGQAASDGRLAAGTATLAALLLFAGATGKSAQFPLHIWLPDAMEGPTPVSALIHAATMVTAGVYLVCRLSPLFTASPTASLVVAITGVATAVLAATMALVQNDIKRVLAYSTISQIGYMFLGCGVGAYGAAMFHLFTHAFFKSLLFLAAGSVIHALSGEQDLRKMGGLRKRLPRTFPAFLVGTLAISGIPFLSGFFSKDAILTSAFSGGRAALGVLGLCGAVLTAFYMFRLLFLAFYGRERLPEDAAAHLHESPAVMTIPLAVLAGLSAVAGYLWLPVLFGHGLDGFRRFLQPVLGAPGGQEGTGMELLILAASSVAAILGAYIAYFFYIRKTGWPASLVARFPGLYRILIKKYGIDEAYNAVFIRPLLGGSEIIYRKFDLAVIDGAVDGAAGVAGRAGRFLGSLQSGFLRDYALAFLLGAVLILGFLLVWP